MDIVKVAYLGSDGEYQVYQPSDTALINTANITRTFGGSSDYIEYYIKDLSNAVLASNYSATQYTIGSDLDPTTGTTSVLYLDPETDARNAGYNRGVVNIKYNFFSRQLASSQAQTFWIKEISTSRTEIKVARQDLSNSDLQAAFLNFNAALSADAYYPDFLLNFGLDRQIIGVNAVYVEEGQDAYIIFKLYEPLPIEFDIKSTFWVVTTVADPAEFNVSIEAEPEPEAAAFQLRGPNFKVPINDAVSQTTPYYNYTSLFSTAVTSSYQQLQSLMDEKGIQINVDYSSFSNFIHFSSATERLSNFEYKLQLIESASAGLQTTNTAAAKIALQNTIDNIITKFDGYEYYLYYTSASTAWPKQNSTQPYTLYSVTSSQARNWLGSINTVPTSTTMSMYYLASTYDDSNKDLLEYTTPAYITDDSSNEPYLIFLNMIGQHFDNIWIYLKDVSNRFSAENNPFVGISMDQVADALRGLGVKLYTNTSISNNIYYSMLGINPNGSLLPPTGSEVITNYITSSIATLPNTQITNEIYKRLYHNIAYLLKTRGTERGIRALVTTYGIPNDVLQVHEYGGYDYQLVPGIQELTRTKILTSSFTPQIKSDLLTTNTTIQLYQNNLMKSSIDLEIGFSPADSINAAITSSGMITSSAQPGYFNIMQLIGDPQLQYSSSYTPLENLKDAYFAANYTSRYNVWDFIRLIKYYNNSLFKMLRDWVPARSSAATGIIIKSHLLERNKYPRHEPTYITSSNEGYYQMVIVSGSGGGCITTSTGYIQAIPVQYNYTASAPLALAPGTVYVASTDNVQQYNGELSGSSILMVEQPFDQQETSTYSNPPTSSIRGRSQIMFTTYSVSPLFENVSGAILSQRFLDLDYNGSQATPVNYGLITKSLEETALTGSVIQSQQPYSQYAQLQDFNYYLQSSINARYSGSTLIGRRYNVYTNGDLSYGNEPVINHYTNKLGFFTQIETSSFLPGKVNAKMAYLADVSGGLLELNQNNKNWQDVQNTFIAGTTLTIKQFDSQKYGNQSSTDGVKRVFNSGYSYTPRLYYNTSTDTDLYFQYAGEGESDTFVATNSPIPAPFPEDNSYISGVPTPFYKPTGPNNIVYNFFGAFDSGTGYETGSKTAPAFPKFTASQAAIKSFRTKLLISVQFTNVGQTAQLQWQLAKNGGSNYYTTSSIVTATQDPPVPTVLFLWYGSTQNQTNAIVAAPSGPVTFLAGPFTTYRKSPYIQNATQTLLGQSMGTPGSWIELQNYTLIARTSTGFQTIVQPGIVRRSSDLNNPIFARNLPLWNEQPSPINPYFVHDTLQGVTNPGLFKTLTFDQTSTPIRLEPSDYVEFKYRFIPSTSRYTASVAPGQNSLLTAITAGGGTTYASASAGSGFITSIINTTTAEASITFNNSISQYTDYEFVPYFESGSTIYSSSLYTQYGDVNSQMAPIAGDTMVLQDDNGTTQTYEVLSSQIQQTSPTSPRSMVVDVVPNVVTNWVNDPSLITRVLILRKYKDEQNIVLTFNKQTGATSYGFLIPDQTNPTVTAQINTLQSAIQSQLLENQNTPG